ncbi:MAG: cobalamin-dependent protein [Anaerolineae bacterium]|jgi:methylmalonyl-CoA mutase cobalamin-binding domain/chain
MGQLADAMVALDKEAALNATQQALAAGQDPLTLVDDARQGLEEVGDKFESGEFFLMELMRAAQIFQSMAEVLNPKIMEVYGGVEATGKVVLGTVSGDIHDLGKNIVKILLECRGAEVIDLGVNVPTEQFVQAVKEHQPQVIGMSALLTASVSEMNRNVEALEEAGVRDQVKVILGGGIVGEIDRAMLRADFATVDANVGIRQIEAWLG